MKVTKTIKIEVSMKEYDELDLNLGKHNSLICFNAIMREGRAYRKKLCYVSAITEAREQGVIDTLKAMQINEFFVLRREKYGIVPYYSNNEMQNAMAILRIAVKPVERVKV